MNRSMADASSTGRPLITWVTRRAFRVEPRRYLAVAVTCTSMRSYLTEAERSALRWPRNVRVGANSPRRCPTMFSVT
jgi:hypothetical protein